MCSENQVFCCRKENRRLSLQSPLVVEASIITYKMTQEYAALYLEQPVRRVNVAPLFSRVVASRLHASEI